MNILKSFWNRKTELKVPTINLEFWTIKLLTTAMGEALSDFLVFHIDPYFSVILTFLAFIMAIIIQFSLKRYFPIAYWFAAGMIAVFGTMVADIIHVVLGVSYIVSCIFFTLILVCIFLLWHRFEKTISIHTITTTKREFFYWATVITTFALGTAVGDLTASSFNLGYFLSGVLFALLILVPAILYFYFKVSEVTTFWIAYILTRPLGASFADWIGKTPSEGGLGLGTGLLSLILLLSISCIIGIVSFKERQLN